MTRKRSLPANVTAYVDRHGKERFRWRKTGHKPYGFREHPGTEARPSDEYRALMANLNGPREPTAAPGSIADLVIRYYRSPAFLNAGDDNRRHRRGLLDDFRSKHGTKRVAMLDFEHVEAILLAKSKKRRVGKRIVGGKVAAQSLRKELIRLFDLAIKLKMTKTNAARLAEGIKAPKGGFHSWTEEEIVQYQARHPLGTKARLALEIILWTGQRRGDARLFGRSHMRGGKIAYTQGKTSKTLWLPAAADLVTAINAMPVTGTGAFLVTDFGKPFTRDGFGNKMRDWCDQAGLPQCSAHGLRKAIARRLAEEGATQKQIKAVGGWSSDSDVATYTAAADQALMADAGMALLANRRDRLAKSNDDPSE